MVPVLTNKRGRKTAGNKLESSGSNVVLTLVQVRIAFIAVAVLLVCWK